jgi:hypothetical protein
MQIIKPERKYIKYQKLLKESDFKLHFHYSINKKTNTTKRFFRASLINFFHNNNLRWKRASFAMKNEKIIFTEGYKKDTFYISKTGYIYNILLVQKICELYKIKIENRCYHINFKCKEIRKNIWELIPE